MFKLKELRIPNDLFSTLLFCLHIEDSLGGLWWLLQTITRTNGPQSTLKLQPVVHLTFLQVTPLVEPISYQLLKQFNHLTTTVTS